MENRALDYAMLEARGVAEVRSDLEGGRLTGARAGAAYSWLTQKDEARRAEAALKSEVFQAEQTATALRAAMAASRSARLAGEARALARSANITARIAAVLAALALAASIAAPLILRH